MHGQAGAVPADGALQQEAAPAHVSQAGVAAVSSVGRNSRVRCTERPGLG